MVGKQLAQLKAQLWLEKCSLRAESVNATFKVKEVIQKCKTLQQDAINEVHNSWRHRIIGDCKKTLLYVESALDKRITTEINKRLKDSLKQTSAESPIVIDKTNARTNTRNSGHLRKNSNLEAKNLYTLASIENSSPECKQKNTVRDHL